jgi:nucleotide-binding universal stress UspA family protein
MNPTLNPIGIALAFLYLSAILMLLRWMFAVSPHLARRMSSGKQAQSNRNCIIVPLTESAASRQAVKLACELALDRKASILLTHVIEIPLTLGLDVRLPDVEEKAKCLLENAESVVRGYDLEVESRVLRHRTATEAILELVRETGAEAIVVGTSSPPWWSLARIGHTVAALLHHAPCQVIVAQSPMPV